MSEYSEKTVMDGVEMTLREAPKFGVPYYEGDRDGVKIIKLLQKIETEDQTIKRAGEFMTPDDYFFLAEGDVEVYKPDFRFAQIAGVEAEGDEHTMRGLDQNLLLLTFRKGVIPEDTCVVAREALRGAAKISQNRGIAAGKLDLDKLSVDAERVQVLSPFRATYTTKDGKQSKTNIANQVRSGIVGFFDSNPRTPYCRTTAFTEQFPDRFAAAVPFVQHVSENFRKLIPHRWQNQKDFADQHDTEEKQFLIPGTVFTTITVNKNFQTALHTDRGDLHQGFGNLTVLERGDYSGGHTVFPAFGVAADVRTGDFIGMDVHEWHGNTELSSNNGEEFERVSVVCYYREKIAECDYKEIEEEKRAKWESRDKVTTREDEDKPMTAGILTLFLDKSEKEGEA